MHRQGRYQVVAVNIKRSGRVGLWLHALVVPCQRTGPQGSGTKLLVPSREPSTSPEEPDRVSGNRPVRCRVNDGLVLCCQVTYVAQVRVVTDIPVSSRHECMGIEIGKGQ